MTKRIVFYIFMYLNDIMLIVHTGVRYFIFVVVCLIKLIPIMEIPEWLSIWIAVIAFIKAINVVSGYVIHRRFVAVHSVMNKVTGAMLFIFPLTLSMIDLKYSAAVVCSAATFAAVQEGHYIRTGRE